jgi:hypothetical protein
MKIFSVMILALLLSTIGYAQVNNVIHTARTRTLIWNEKSKQWDLLRTSNNARTFTLINGVYYVDDRANSKYTLHSIGINDYSQIYNTVTYKNTTDEENDKCGFSISTFPDGLRVVAIEYQNYSICYFEK